MLSPQSGIQPENFPSGARLLPDETKFDDCLQLRNRLIAEYFFTSHRNNPPKTARNREPHADCDAAAARVHHRCDAF